ncbi:MAG: stage II sporulation protein M [Pseudomonadota bacterium]
MNLHNFIQQHEKQWVHLELLIHELSDYSFLPSSHSSTQLPKKPKKTLKNKNTPKSPEQIAAIAEFPSHYRQVCQHLALARDHHFPSHLIDRLNTLVLAGHQLFYASHASLKHQIIEFLIAGFPIIVRKHIFYFWIALAIFMVSVGIMALTVWLYPESIYSLIPPTQVADFERMYHLPQHTWLLKRESDDNIQMFGFYIQHNISIGFSCFAGGLIFGVGSVIPLMINGLLLGATSVHLIRLGYKENFLQFIVAHSAFELTAIVLCGMAGLMLGHALIAPERLTRKESLATHAKPAVNIMYGATVMLLIAAFIEAFWSSSHYVTVEGKYGVGGLCWLSVIGYFACMGRKRETNIA